MTRSKVVIVKEENSSPMAMAPLKGFRLIVLRSPEQSQELTENLMTLGADVIQCPMIELVPNKSVLNQINSAFLENFEIIIFTSVNGVKIFMDALLEKGIDIKLLANKRILAVGPKTNDILKQYGVIADAMPKKFMSESLLELLGENIAGKKILIPTASDAREVLPKGLEKKGAQVNVLKIYKNVMPQLNPVTIENGDFVIFTSPSTADRFFNSPLYQQQDVIAFCIGEVTQKAVSKYLSKNMLVSNESTVNSLVDCICQYAKNLKGI